MVKCSREEIARQACLSTVQIMSTGIETEEETEEEQLKRFWTVNGIESTSQDFRYHALAWQLEIHNFE